MYITPLTGFTPRLETMITAVDPEKDSAQITVYLDDCVLNGQIHKPALLTTEEWEAFAKVEEVRVTRPVYVVARASRGVVGGSVLAVYSIQFAEDLFLEMVPTD